MKKKLITGIIIVAVLLFIVIMLAIHLNHNNDAFKFKKEYEKYNGEKYSDDTKEYLIMSISKNSIMKYSDFNEIQDVLTRGTGVIYFGFPTCPWCRNIVPVLLDAASNTELDKIYYFNALSIRDIKKINDEGNIEVVKAGTDEYYKLIDILSPYLGNYKDLGDLNIKRLYFPTIVFVKEGKVVDIHIGTVSEHTNGYEELTIEQKATLKETLISKINKTLVKTCTEGGC